MFMFLIIYYCNYLEHFDVLMYGISIVVDQNEDGSDINDELGAAKLALKKKKSKKNKKKKINEEDILAEAQTVDGLYF